MNAKKELVYFNYHEFVTNGELIAFTRKDESIEKAGHSIKLVVSHFPNPYVPEGSDVYYRTRIVRIPRIFDTIPNLERTPQFSLYVPGKEPAALIEAEENTVYGSKDNYIYTNASTTQLVPQWVSETELHDMVLSINERLRRVYPTVTWASALRSMADFATGTLFSLVLRWFKNEHDPMKELETYFESVNQHLSEKHRDLKLVSLTDSGMLSLDFQIPLTAIEPKIDTVAIEPTVGLVITLSKTAPLRSSP